MNRICLSPVISEKEWLAKAKNGQRKLPGKSGVGAGHCKMSQILSCDTVYEAGPAGDRWMDLRLVHTHI